MASDKLQEAIRDRSLPAPEKSRIVRDNAMTMMNSLLEQPTSKNIRTDDDATSYTLADVFDALTSDRPYRKKMAPFDALILMKKEMINHFQKDIYEKFVFMLM